MQKIASPQELQAELRRILASTEGPERPSREALAFDLNELADRIAGKKVAGMGAADFSRMVASFMLKESNDLHKSVKAWLKPHLKGESVALPDGRLDDVVHDLIYDFDGKTAKAAVDSYKSMMRYLKSEFSAKGKKASDDDMAERLVDRVVDRVAADNPYKKLAARADDLIRVCQEVSTTARDAVNESNRGAVARVDNMARQSRMYEAKFNLFAKALKEAEGYSS